MAETLLEIMVRAHGDHDSGEVFEEYAQAASDKTLIGYLETIAQHHWAWSTEANAVEYLSERFRDRKAVTEWAAQRSLRAIQMDPAQASRWASFLDKLAPAITDKELRTSVDDVREQGVLTLCRGIRSGQSELHATRVLDNVSLRGIRRFTVEITKEYEAALVHVRSKASEAEESARTAYERIQLVTQRLEQIQNSYRRSEAGVAFRERKRLLTDLAEITAQFDDSAHQYQSKDLAAVVMPLESLMLPFGVHPFSEIGEPTVFDLSQYGLVTPRASPDDSARVARKGFTIEVLRQEVW